MALQVDRREDGSLAFFIDGDLQFDSQDEANYHEALALPAVMVAAQRKTGTLKAFIAGGGDGLTARELLKCSRIDHIDLVDMDATVLDVSRSDFAPFNQNSLEDRRVSVHTEDAWSFAEGAISSGICYDIIVSDLTVPNDAAGARMHSIEWYQLLCKLLNPAGVIAANTVSPCATPRAWWSIVKSIRTAGAHPRPLRVVVPSFARLGYGPDWGFVLASPQPITSAELQTAAYLPSPRKVINDIDQLHKLFLFPQELVEYERYAVAAHSTSDILIHYLCDDDPLVLEGQLWSTLDTDFDKFSLDNAESEARVLSPEIRTTLASDHEDEQTLFERVIALVPGLNRAHSRALLSDFLSNPMRFLEAIDLQGLVMSLLRRAAELPKKLVAELELLRDRLYDWCGDEHALLRSGSRVLSIVAVVVILSNLMYPDSVYAKGGHGGGDHAAGGRGDHGDHGDRGRGDRGDRGDRRAGFDRGFNHGYDHYGHWGGDRFGHWNNWHQWGGWGGWARPYHGWYGGWGGWGWAGVPAYAGSGGFINLNLNKTTGQVVDEEGSVYPARKYNYQQNAYNDNSSSQAIASGDTSNNGAPTQQSEADFRLGPDVDVLPGGRVALQLTDAAYMLVGPTVTKVMDQSTGAPIMTLSTDPALLAHLQSEVKRQTLGLQSAAQSKQSSVDWSSSTGMKGDTDQEGSEVQNVQQAVDLLNQAAQNLGPTTEASSRPIPPPVPGSMEVFSSTWLTPDGHFIVIKRGDGSLAYMNASGWYSDAGTTKLSDPYPNQFKTVVVAYLQNLAKGGGAEQSRLHQEQKDAQDRLQTLHDKLQQLQGGGTTTMNGSGAAVQIASDGNNGNGNSANAASGGNISNASFDESPEEQPEALRRLKQAITRTQKRLQATNRQLERFPQEMAAINTALQMLQGQ